VTVEDRPYYLVENTPHHRQYRDPRKAPVSGTFVVHTAENMTDLVLPDDGAEGVANFMRTRSSPGAYHSIMDSDSTVPVVPPWMQAFHDGTGSNAYSIGISFACRAEQWPHLPTEWVVGAMNEAGKEVALLIDWVKDTTGIVVPLKHITGKESSQRLPGFTTHKEREDYAGTPGRRHDPGAAFPWDLFFAAITLHLTGAPMTDVERILWSLDELLATTRLSTTPRKLVRAAYAQIFERTPDRSGGAHWRGYLRDGGSVAEMVRLMQGSDEAKAQIKL